MASDTPNGRMNAAIEKIRDSPTSNDDKDAILQLAEKKELSQSSRAAYLETLSVVIKATDQELKTLDTDDWNQLIKEMKENRGWSKSTTRNYQSAVKHFVESQGMNPDAIVMERGKVNKAIDERSVLSEQEFHDLREATTRPRDLALVDFLGYSGQRISAVQHLTIEDIDIANGIWYFPETPEGIEEGEGFKGADKVGNKRPLLGARKSMSDWLERHPTGEPDDHVFTAMPSAPNSTPGDMMNRRSIQYILDTVKERAGVEKPANPHAFRHHFVTVAKKRHKMDDDRIKHLIGHKPDSNVMNTTYAHLSDDDHIKEAEKSFGIRDESDEPQQAPPVCPRCQRPLRPDAKRCPSQACGEVFHADEPETEIEQLAAEIEEKVSRFEELQDALDR